MVPHVLYGIFTIICLSIVILKIVQLGCCCRKKKKKKDEIERWSTLPLGQYILVSLRLGDSGLLDRTRTHETPQSWAGRHLRPVSSNLAVEDMGGEPHRKLSLPVTSRELTARGLWPHVLTADVFRYGTSRALEDLEGKLPREGKRYRW